MDKIAVLIPCYNEGQTIAKVVKDYREALPEATIYVYDNNSSDHTDEIAREAGAVVRYEYQQGKGNVIRSMFRDIDAECYVMTDGDDTYPAEDARKLADQILQGKADIMTGARAFNYEFVKSFPILSTGFEIETEMSIHALDKNFKLVEIPVGYRDRPEGSVSKLNTFSDGFKVLRTIARLFRDYKPFAFFGWLGLICFAIATAFFAPVLSGYLATGMVPKFPTLIACSGLYVISFLLWISGVILEVITKKHRQLFELYLNQLSILKRRDG